MAAPDVEMVAPEVAHDLEELLVGVDGTLDVGVVHLFEQLVLAAIAVLDGVVRHVGIGQRRVAAGQS